MKVDSFSYGSIVISGTTYDHDVIIFPDRVESPWVREEEHRPHIGEFAGIVKAEPEVLVIGTGYAGVISIPDQIRNYLTSKGITVHVEKTAAAIDRYHSLLGREKVVAALHITC